MPVLDARVIVIHSRYHFVIATGRPKEPVLVSREIWEIIADNLSNADWSLAWVSALDVEGRPIWIADAHRDGKRFLVRADEKLTAFLGLESKTPG